MDRNKMDISVTVSPVFQGKCVIYIYTQKFQPQRLSNPLNLQTHRV